MAGNSIFSHEQENNIDSPLGNWYQELLDKQAEEKRKKDTIQIFSIKVDEGKSIDGLIKQFDVIVELSSSPVNHKVEIEIDGKVFVAGQDFSSINTLGRFFYATVNITFSTVVRYDEIYQLTARLIDLTTNTLISSKSINVKVTDKGYADRTNEELYNNENLITLPNFISIFGSKKLFTHKDMKIYENVYDIDKQIFVNKLRDNLINFEINNAIRISHFFGQIEHESDHLNTTQEYASGNDYNNRKDLGNIQEGDGPRFKGRGLIQLTGRNNYAKFSLFYNSINNQKIDFTIEPNNQLLVSDIDFSIKASCWFWQIFKGLNQYADEDDLIYITYTINGGFNGYNDRKLKTQKSLKVLNTIIDEDFNKELGVYNLEDSKLYNTFSGTYIWAKYHDENYPNLLGTDKDKEEAKKAYMRAIYLYENEKVKKTKNNIKKYENAKKRYNNI